MFFINFLSKKDRENYKIVKIFILSNEVKQSFKTNSGYINCFPI